MTDDTRARELLSCPFCGESNANICKTRYLDTHAYAVSCRSRGCHGASFQLGYGLFETEAEAITAWNTRALASPQDVGVERAALQKIAALAKVGASLNWGDAQDAIDIAEAALASAPAQPVDEDGPSDGAILALAEEARRAIVSQPAGYLVDPGAGSAADHYQRGEPSPTQYHDMALRGGHCELLYTGTSVEKMILHVARRLASRPTQGRKVREALEAAERVFFFDLAGKREFGPNYNQAVVDAGDKIRAALSIPLDPPENSATVETVCAYEAGLAEGRAKGLEDAKKAVEHCNAERRYHEPTDWAYGAQDALVTASAAIDNLIGIDNG